MSQAPEATLRQQRGLEKEAEDVAALQWQHQFHLCSLQVQKIVSCIYDSLKDIQKPAIRHYFDSLLMKVADKNPEAVVTTLLNIAPQGDRYWP